MPMNDRLRELWRRAVPPRQRVPALALAGLVLGYALFGFLVVPRIIRSQIHKRAALSLHREATVAKVRFNPFTLAARLIRFDLRDRDGTPLVAFDTLLVNLELVSLVDRAWVLKEIRLVRPQISARILTDGKPAIADLFEVPPSANGAPADTAPATMPRLKISLLSIVSGGIDFIDDSRSPRYEEQFEDLGLTLEKFSTLPKEQGGHYLTVSFASGAEIKWTGTVSMQPLLLNGRFLLSRLQLPRMARVLGGHLPLTVSQGEGQASFSYEVTQRRDGRFTVTIPDASLNVSDLALRPHDGDSDWVKVPRIEVRGLTVHWPARTASLELLRITQPWVTATRLADSTLNWAPYLPPPGSAPAATAPDTATPWTASIATIELDSGTVHLEDRTVTPMVALDLSAIGLRLDTVATDPRTRTGVTASMRLGKGTTFTASGTAVRQPLATDLDIELANLDVALVQPYLGPNPPIIIVGGLAGTRGKVHLRDTRPKLLFEGSAGLDGLVINDSAKAPFLTWKATRVRGIRLTSDPDLLRIRRIEVVQPFARIAISRDQQINLSSLASLRRQPPAAPDTTAPFPFEISEIVFKDAEIDYSDESLILPFRTRIHSTEGAIRDVASFGGTPGTLELNGQIDEYGLARANGVLRLSDPYSATSINADFRNVEMPRLTPYTAEFLGYAIREGRLDVDMKYTIQNRQLHAEHHIVVKNLQLGDKMEGGSGPPGFAVKLAVSLLKDRQGNIKLDPLVEGTVDSPEFSYKKIVWQAVKQILGKIATAPFRFLGKLLGIGGDAPELVEFDPGSTVVIPPEREKLDSLAAEMVEKPELTLSIEGRFDSISDQVALREGKLKLQVEAQRDSSAARTQKADTGTTVMAAILENLYLKAFSRAALDSLRSAFTASAGGPPPAAPGKPKKESQAPPPPPPATGFNAAGYYDSMRVQLLAAQPVDPAELLQLGRDRGSAIAAVLSANPALDSTRVKVADPAPVSKKKAGSSRIASEMSMDAK